MLVVACARRPFGLSKVVDRHDLTEAVPTRRFRRSRSQFEARLKRQFNGSPARHFLAFGSKIEQGELMGERESNTELNADQVPAA
jgi:hypothetical protein